MTKSMNVYSAVAMLLLAGLSACDKNTVQQLPTEPLLGSRIRFFNFGVNAPGVNFYADNVKLTAIRSETGVESTNGVAYGGVGNGGGYSQIAPGSHQLTGRIAATTDKDLAIDTLTAALADGKYYSFFLSGFYNTIAKTVDAFAVEDPIAPPTDFTKAQIRFVNAIGNASPLTLYARNTTVGDTTAIGGAVAYKSAGTFVAVPVGIYDLFARYTDSTTNKVARTAVTFLGGHIYTIGARGDITITSTTATNRPFLDATPNW
ncbi:MAG TPA: DUF4397 domain-containing protein [Gemmatimonadales bacterium]|jgi:hypothetical protein|nr:DUF4397 domain-containing protein [Gemmatimonadales bacterium]